MESDSPQLLQAVDFEIHSFIHEIREKRNHAPRKSSSTRQEKIKSNLWSELQEEQIDFQKQLDEIALWFEKWSHEERCSILEHLISIGDYSQFQLLWTASQPIFHRDFMYTAKDRYPDESFIPISTEATRATRQRLTRNRTLQRFHRAKSAYFRDEVDVKSNVGLLPSIRKSKQLNNKIIYNDEMPSTFRLPQLHHRRSLTTPIDHLLLSNEDPESNWRTARQVRRHIQEIKENQTTPENSDLLYQLYTHWSGPKRATFLRLALMKLDARQLYFLSTYLAVRRHRDMLDLLPSDVSHLILSYLSPSDLVNCAKVSKSWQELCYHNRIWRQKCAETQLDIRPVCTPALGGWRSAYKDDTNLKKNWNVGQCATMRLTGHTGSVLAVACNAKILVSGGKDATVRTWKIASGRLLQTFTGHQKGVWAVAILTDHLVASGSYDRTVKVWSITPGRVGCLRTLYGHHGPIWCMISKKNYLASGSQDRVIKLWDIRHCTLRRTLKGHTSAVFALDGDDNMKRIFSGSADKTIRVWNTEDGVCLKVIWTGEATSIMSVSYSHGLLACASGGHVALWNPNTGVCIRSFHAHKKRIETVQLKLKDSNSGIIMSGGKDGRLKYWNAFGNGKVKKLDGHDGQINSICSDATRIITASYDNTILVWNFREKTMRSRGSTI